MFELTPFERRNRDLFSMFDEIERELFGDPFGKLNIRGASEAGVMPFKTDVLDKGDSFVLEAELPGFDKEDIKLDIDGDMLTISAEKNEESEEKDKKGNFLRRERHYGCYSRSFNIAQIDESGIEAAYDKGVLTVTLPKKQKTVPASRRLEIK